MDLGRVGLLSSPGWVSGSHCYLGWGLRTIKGGEKEGCVVGLFVHTPVCPFIPHYLAALYLHCVALLALRLVCSLPGHPRQLQQRGKADLVTPVASHDPWLLYPGPATLSGHSGLSWLCTTGFKPCRECPYHICPRTAPPCTAGSSIAFPAPLSGLLAGKWPVQHEGHSCLVFCHCPSLGPLVCVLEPV